MISTQKKTKIVCTVGPSTDKPGILAAMIESGMNVARFNFSHGTHADHAKRITLVREAANKAGKHIALMLDTKGPEMRIGKFAENKVMLVAGQSFTLTGQDIIGTTEMVSVNHKNLAREVSPGTKILLSDGLIELMIDNIEGDAIITTVLNSGEISNNKRVAVPGVCINLPPVSEQDQADILFGVEQGMDCIAASFIQQPSDVLAIRRILENAKVHMAIIAKIENAPGVTNIDDILKVADGVMVARGDLGVEIPTEDVPLIQKLLIGKCNQAGKPVITATQMLESMMTNPRPTRAEASDIANAIMDGTDAIMLSGETASGHYPAEAVNTMQKIALRTEQNLKYQALRSSEMKTQHTTTAAISHASAQIAHELTASAIITTTQSGYTPRMISKYRPDSPVIAVTPSPKTARQVQLLWGVYPVVYQVSPNSDQMVDESVRAALSAGLVQTGDLVVVTAGVPVGTQGTTNMIRVHLVADVLLRGQGIGEQAVTGKVCVINSPNVLQDYSPGDVLVTTGIDETIASYATKAAAIITEEGGLSSNAAIIGINYNLPAIVGAAGAVDILKNGTIVTVDASRGLVYAGKTNAR
ncbi:pyruvate kinase [Sporomusaceae bacterium FL31]|nr:pyruvate kinase [Sporomusaceae bacterium FL31]GCE33216.1 pyruvate kinase [Sporomusaceae bacterium]